MQIVAVGSTVIVVAACAAGGATGRDTQPRNKTANATTCFANDLLVLSIPSH